MKTLVVTNDFPPRAGGIQTFVYELIRRLPAASAVVYASSSPGAVDFDRQQPFPVIRHPGAILLPTPPVVRRAVEIARTEDCDSVWFGAAAPLALMAPRLRGGAGVQTIVASTHGHEVGWARLPAARQALRRIATSVDVLTYLGDYTRGRMAPAIAGCRLERLSPGVDTDRFNPGVDGDAVRRRHGLAARPTVVCVSRLVPRKGQDTLIRALPLVAAHVPDVALLIVGGGDDRPRLERLAATVGVADDVVFAGAVSTDELPEHYAAGDVFAMPCRSRRGGLEVEGLGIVYLEASAVGLPVVAGDSGGAPDAVLPGETGHVVDGKSPRDVARALINLLSDLETAQRMGRRGREWVLAEWQWDALAGRLDRLLRSGQRA